MITGWQTSIFVYSFCLPFLIFRIRPPICNNPCSSRIGFKSNKKAVPRWASALDDGFDLIWKGSDLYSLDDEDLHFKNRYVLREFHVFSTCKALYVNNNSLYILLCGKSWKLFPFKTWFGDVFRHVMFTSFTSLSGSASTMCKKVGPSIHMLHGKSHEIRELQGLLYCNQ